MRRVIGKRSTEDRRASQAHLPFQISSRGIVNLARRWVRGKVATRARIVQGSFPVARQQLSGPIWLDVCHELPEMW